MTRITGAELWVLAKESVAAWIDDYASSMGAALSFYTMFSIAPLLVIAIAIAGFVFGQDAARGQILEQMHGLIGAEGAIALQGLLKSASEPTHGVLGMITGVALLFVGATSAFVELQTALDRIWRSPAVRQETGVVKLIRSRLLSLGMVAAIGFLLMVSLAASAALAALGKWWGSWFGAWKILLDVVNEVVSFTMITALFAVIYKVLPRVKIAWRDVWVGAMVTSLLFAIGKFLIGYYLGTSSVASGFGAAASLVVLLVWVYYSAQIFLFGAEFTWVYSHRYGSRANQPESSPAPSVPRRAAPLQRG
jgi:membrane protein